MSGPASMRATLRWSRRASRSAVARSSSVRASLGGRSGTSGTSMPWSSCVRASLGRNGRSSGSSMSRATSVGSSLGRNRWSSGTSVTRASSVRTTLGWFQRSTRAAVARATCVGTTALRTHRASGSTVFRSTGMRASLGRDRRSSRATVLGATGMGTATATTRERAFLLLVVGRSVLTPGVGSTRRHARSGRGSQGAAGACRMALAPWGLSVGTARGRGLRRSTTMRARGSGRSRRRCLGTTAAGGMARAYRWFGWSMLSTARPLAATERRLDPGPARMTAASTTGERWFPWPTTMAAATSATAASVG